MDLKTFLQKRIDNKTKPPGSLGLLEDIAVKTGLILGTAFPKLRLPHIVIFAADHGLAAENISAYPQEVTRQMVLNFLQGGAAINCFCRQHGIQLCIVDAGVKSDFESHPLLIQAKAARGSRNMLKGKAMSRQEYDRCLQAGASIVKDIAAKGCNIIGFGEMGIGNTSSASLIMAALYQLPIEECTGKGTGLADEQLQHKIDILKAVLRLHNTVSEASDIACTFGGFEIVQMMSAMIEARRQKMIILIDGFIATAALALAAAMHPSVADHCICCHVSNERGHRRLLELLGQPALLQLDLRLGEGTGCALAFPLVQSAVNFLNEMASFEEAGISNKK